MAIEDKLMALKKRAENIGSDSEDNQSAQSYEAPKKEQSEPFNGASNIITDSVDSCTQKPAEFEKQPEQIQTREAKSALGNMFDKLDLNDRAKKIMKLMDEK